MYCSFFRAQSHIFDLSRRDGVCFCGIVLYCSSRSAAGPTF
eukprot:CCRYP_004286-RA/>CCRYP_004286-RA protein AED:0.36 eAED:0.36 QI:68/1/1/1/0/0/2/101/40